MSEPSGRYDELDIFPSALVAALFSAADSPPIFLLSGQLRTPNGG